MFANSVKIHIKISRPGHDLPTSVNERVKMPFHKGFFIQTSPSRSFAKIKSSRKFPNLQYLCKGRMLLLDCYAYISLCAFVFVSIFINVSLFQI